MALYKPEGIIFVDIIPSISKCVCPLNVMFDNDNDKPIKSLLKGKGLLPPVGLARLDS
jgi:hypothetical protein